MKLNDAQLLSIEVELRDVLYILQHASQHLDPWFNRTTSRWTENEMKRAVKIMRRRNETD